MPSSSWTLLGSNLLRDYGAVRVREDKYRFTPTGAIADFAVCDSADWVLVIPITVDNDVVFVRQFRHGRREVILEIPGGLMEPNEKPSETAERELQEETGYVPKQMETYGPLLPNPALNTARFHVVVATGCSPTAAPSPDPFEQLEIEVRPLASISQMIRGGELQHALCVAAFAISGVYSGTTRE